MPLSRFLLWLLVVAGLSSCKAFKFGYSQNKAENTYNLVTGNKKNTGDKRIRYIQHLYKDCALSRQVKKETPDFIFEYKTADKRRGIHTYYIQKDSVYIFEEPQKNRFCSTLKEARLITAHEKQVYQQLQLGMEVKESYRLHIK